METTTQIPSTEAIQPQLVAALDDAYEAMRVTHPDLPKILITIEQPPPATARNVAWHVNHVTVTAGGTYAGRITFSYAYSWILRPKPSVLYDGPEKVLEVLAHEAAHALATARGIKDTSRGGRWHNKAYAALARELGLSVEQSGDRGWSATSATPVLLERYGDHLAEIGMWLPHGPDPARAD